MIYAKILTLAATLAFSMSSALAFENNVGLAPNPNLNEEKLQGVQQQGADLQGAKLQGSNLLLRKQSAGKAKVDVIESSSRIEIKK